MKTKKVFSKGYMSPAGIAARKSHALVLAYSTELDALREKYGYAVIEKPKDQFCPLWTSSARVPSVARIRMVKLMRMIDFLVSGKTFKYNYWADAPTLERYRWRCMTSYPDGTGHPWKSFSSTAYQLREKPL